MTNPDTLTITNDKQLQAFGIFTTDSGRVGQDSLLSRQDFRDTQQEELDEYSTDEVFRLTIASMIERGAGVDLSTGWATPQAALYIHGRRPSQPDFLIDPGKANEAFLASRHRVNSLADGNRLGMDYDRLSVLRGTLARAGFAVITMKEFEQPLRLSGDVYMSPPWQKRALERDPFMLTIGDFTRHMRKLRVNKGLAHTAFRYVGRELLDDSRADAVDSHETATEYLHGNTYIDYAAGLFSLDSVAAFRLVFQQWHKLVQSGKELPFESELDNRYSEWGTERDNIVQLAQLAISDRIPHAWFNRAGKLTPPSREEDFDF